jgi:hypothetical protein
LISADLSSVGGVYLESRLNFLREAQNPDGGWGYFPGKQSWFEPSTYAMLALQGTRGSEESLERGWKLLCTWRTPDGSSRPNGQVQEGTWVTAQAVTLACVRGVNDDHVRKSVDWLLRVSGAESSMAMRTAAFFHLLKTKADVSHQGWPWRDGNASWVEPTVQALIALKKFPKNYRSAEIERRVNEGEALIVSRRCSDGGWNCGNPNVLDYDLPSYPETTALALLGLQGRRKEELAEPLALAARFRAQTRSSLARAWLVIALRCHGIDEQRAGAEASTSNDVMLTALEALGHPEGNYRLLRTGATS